MRVHIKSILDEKSYGISLLILLIKNHLAFHMCESIKKKVCNLSLVRVQLVLVHKSAMQISNKKKEKCSAFLNRSEMIKS
jgi:hypothetical protein